MAGKRLNDTAAICAPGDAERLSMEVRPIENGYVTRHSRHGKDGYESREVFSAQKPEMAMPADATPKETSTLHRATDYLRKPTDI
jgi:hypothetical protein